MLRKPRLLNCLSALRMVWVQSVDAVCFCVYKRLCLVMFGLGKRGNNWNKSWCWIFFYKKKRQCINFLFGASCAHQNEWGDGWDESLPLVVSFSCFPWLMLQVAGWFLCPFQTKCQSYRLCLALSLLFIGAIPNAVWRRLLIVCEKKSLVACWFKHTFNFT